MAVGRDITITVKLTVPYRTMSDAMSVAEKIATEAKAIASASSKESVIRYVKVES